METELITKHPEASDIWSFYFRKPAWFAFTPGDYAELSLDFAPQGGRRWFSLASAPGEPHLRITTQLPSPASEYKQALSRLEPGDRAFISPPMGNFNLPATKDKVLLVAGGVGVTPYRSMLASGLADPHDTVLLYTARPDNFIFAPELDGSDARIIRHDSAAGRLDLARFDQLVPDWRERMVFLAGPEAMMSRFHDEILRLDHVPGRLRLSYFPGYRHI